MFCFGIFPAYGFGELYEVLLVARSLQGVASSFTSIGGKKFVFLISRSQIYVDFSVELH